MKYLEKYELFEGKDSPEKMMKYAISHMNLYGIEMLIDKVNINWLYDGRINYLQLLIGAVNENKKIKKFKKIAKLLIDKGIDINHELNERPIITNCNNVECFKFLCENGAEVTDDMIFSYCQIYDGNEIREETNKICRYLVEEKNINLNILCRYTPLTYSCQKNNFELFNLFLENGADPNLGKNPLGYCGTRYKYIDILLDYNCKIPEGYLYYIYENSGSSSNPSVDITKKLLEKGANPLDKVEIRSSRTKYEYKTIFDVAKRNKLTTYYSSYEFQKFLLDKYGIDAVPYLLKNIGKSSGIKPCKEIYKHEFYDIYINASKLGLF
jgi:hypothetical protein